MKYLILIALALIIHLLPAQGDYTQIWGNTANQGNFAATDLGDTARNRNAIGEFDSHSKAMLFPRLTTTQQDAISSPANGMFIYNTDSLKVCWYTGAAWVCSSTGGAPAGNYWGVNGNTGNTWSNFIGTTDTSSFQIKVHNIKSGIIDINNGNTSFGFETLNSSTGANANNTAIGYLNNSSLTTGGNNVSLGSNCLTDNTTGSNNVAIGYDAQLNSTTAIENTSIGTGAGATIVTGTGNTVVGYGTDVYLSNTIMGTAIGFEAVALDNSVSLGNYAGGAINALNLSSYIDSIRCPGMPTGIGYGLFDVHGDGYLTLQSIPYPTGAYWNIGGNTGSNTSTNYIGTTDNHSLLFKTNSVPVMWLDSATQYAGIGTTAPTSKLQVVGSFQAQTADSITQGVVVGNQFGRDAVHNYAYNSTGDFLGCDVESGHGNRQVELEAGNYLLNPTSSLSIQLSAEAGTIFFSSVTYGENLPAFEFGSTDANGTSYTYGTIWDTALLETPKQQIDTALRLKYVAGSGNQTLYVDNYGNVKATTSPVGVTFVYDTAGSAGYTITVAAYTEYQFSYGGGTATLLAVTVPQGADGNYFILETLSAFSSVTFSGNGNLNIPTWKKTALAAGGRVTITNKGGIWR